MRPRFRTSTLVGALAVALAVVPSTALTASATASGASASELGTLQRLNPAAITAAAHVSPTTSGPTALRSTVLGVTTTIPHSPTSGVTVTDHGERLTVGLPFAAQAQSAQTLTTGTVAYGNGNGTTTVPIAQNDGSVRFNTIIANASAPKRLSYRMNLPAGDTLKKDSKGGVDILNAHGAWVAGIAPVWAKDSNDHPVADHYEIDGGTLTQVVDTTPNTAFPVVTSQLLGLTIIDHVTWENVSQWSPTLAVFPTTFGRYFAPNIAEGSAWDEVRSQGGNGSDTPTMRTQFDCHWYAVRVYAPNKPSWDLDSLRPDTSLVNEINYKCNYPDGGEEW